MASLLNSILLRVASFIDFRILRHRHVEFCLWIGEREADIGQCEEDGCDEIGGPCFYPDHAYGHGPDVFYCYEHIKHSGFCSGCGLFWGGIESFDFDPHNYCDNCRDNPDVTGDWTAYDEAMDELDPYEEEAYR